MKRPLPRLLSALLCAALNGAPAGAAVSLYSGLDARLKAAAAARPAEVPQVPAASEAANPAPALPAASASPQTLATRPVEDAAAFAESAPPEGAALSAAFDGADDHVRAAIAEYFGALAPGEEPGVVVSRRAATQEAPTDDEMLARVKESKKTNPEREAAVIQLFVRNGAKYDPATAKVARPDLTRYDEVQVQEVLDRRGGPTGKHNIFVVKKGRDPKRFVVNSSHNDKVEVGDGVIDNWTGTTLVTNLHKTERDRETEAGRVYVAFAREEEGLLGSLFFLRSMAPEQRAMVEANLNYDTIAIKGGATNSWENNSDAVLLDAGDAAVAEANKSRPATDQLSLERGHLEGGDADSSSFRWQKPPIPAMTIYSGPEELVFSIIHSVRDNLGAFDLLLYKNTFHVAVALLGWLDRHPVPHPAIG